MELLLVRILFVSLVAALGYSYPPLALAPLPAALLGAVAAAAVIAAELRLRRLSLGRLLGAVTGSIVGMVGAALVALVLRSAMPAGATATALQLFLLLLLSYLGLLVGAGQGSQLHPAALAHLFAPADKPASVRILDTSVIIDGRIADVAETGFLDGPLLVPEFVLRELQAVADSADSSRRQRGRRGLDILQRLQAIPALQLEIISDDFPAIREVDLKLLELARRRNARLVTNDFNLNKVAQLQHVEVLNLNDLANALRPVFLPGEKMQIHILKEGREFDQGVGYLDDGTMVVVDHARRAIGRSVEITVTSALQTASGKMIFGRFDESTPRSETPRSETLRSEALRSEPLRSDTQPGDAQPGNSPPREAARTTAQLTH